MSRLERLPEEGQYESGATALPTLNIVPNGEASPASGASAQNNPQHLAPRYKPIPPLTAHGTIPADVLEYDLTTIFTAEQWEARGVDANKRFLFYPLPGEEVETFWPELRQQIKVLKDHQTLYIRMDRVHLYMQTAASLVRSLFYREEEDGGWTRRKKVVLVNPDESTMQQIYFALEVKNELCMLLQAAQTDQPETWEAWYICTPQPSLKSVLDLLRKHRSLTSNDILRLDASITDVQRRLKALHELGLISRASSTGPSPTTSVVEKGKSPPAAKQNEEAPSKNKADATKADDTVEDNSERLMYTYTLFHPCEAYLSSTQAEGLPFHVYDPLTAERAHSLLQAGEKAHIQNKVQKTQENANRSLKLYEAMGDLTGTAACLFLLGKSARFKGTEEGYAESLAYHDRSLQIRSHLGDERALADSLHNMGLLYAERPAADENEQQSFDETCLDYYHKALDLREKIGDFLETSTTLNNMANKYAFRREFAKAFEYDVRSLNRAVEAENQYAIGRSVLSFSVLSELQEEWERVVVLVTIGKRIFDQAKLPLPTSVEKNNALRLKIAAKHLNNGKQFKAAQALGTRMALTEAINYACKTE